mgnify:CR=1 FL=1
MTVTKRVYVLMLSLIIVLSGCLGGTSDGQDGDDVGDTIINNTNNYWNNTTEVINELPERIAIGGFVGGGNGHTSNISAIINTTAGQMMRIDEARIDCMISCNIHLETTCTDHMSFSIYITEGGENVDWLAPSNVEAYVPGSAFDCTHTIGLYTNTAFMSWSLVYSIHPVTVG